MAIRWYVVHVYSGFEKKVAEAIRDQAVQQNMEDLFEEILVPTEEVIEMRRGQKVSTERKFVPGYVLAKMELISMGEIKKAINPADDPELSDSNAQVDSKE